MSLGSIGGQKSSNYTHQLQVDIREWNGEFGVDVRRWQKFGEDWKPTKKGIRIRINELRDAITLFERAEQELMKEGIIKTTA